MSNFSNIPTLRDYQQDFNKNTYKLMQKGERSILNVLPTGGGKTIVFSDLTRAFVQRKKRVWILTHREEIRLQTVEKLASFGLQPGQIAADRPMTSNLVQVASVQTLVNQLDVLKYMNIQPDILIIDEAHHAVAPTWLKILEYWPHCINLGYTATPLRLDGQPLGNIYSSMNVGPDSLELVEADYLSDIAFFTSPLSLELSKIPLKIVNKDYDNKEQTFLMSQQYIVQDTLYCYKKFFDGAPIIVFCLSVDDCYYMSDIFNENGWKSVVIEGGMDKEVRKEYIEGLGIGKYNIICNYDVLGEGVDIPVLAGVILRRRTASLINYLQWIGRTLRKYQGKKYGIIVDQAGNYFIHGHPFEKREWSLARKPKQTSPVSIQICLNGECLAVIRNSPSHCPYCGYPLKEEKTNLKPIKKAEINIIDAELLQVQKPVYVPSEEEYHSNVITETSDDLLNKIIEESSTQTTQIHTIRDRLRFLDKAFQQNPQTRKAWLNYLGDKNNE